MKSLFKPVKKQPVVRASTVSTLEASTSVPDSGLAFVNNSQGVSAAIVELSELLDDVFKDIKYDGDPGDFAKLELDRLDDEASKYCNSRWEPSPNDQSWSCDPTTAPLLRAAAKCSAAIYKHSDPIPPDDYSYAALKYVEPTMLGTTKATAIYEAKTLNLGPERGGFVVVAVRGSASKIDHIVNLNNQAVDVGSFIKLAAPDLPQRNLPLMKVHSGFLNGAKALSCIVDKRLLELENAEGPKRILFTGHSAGGAVTSLLFLHFLSAAAAKYPSLKMTCITFGSPPTSNRDFASFVAQHRLVLNNGGVHLNFINEYDLVPRADKSYIRALVDLCRARYLKPPIEGNRYPGPLEADEAVGERLKGISEKRKSRKAQQHEGSSSGSAENPQSSRWPLPPLEFGHIGDLILLTATASPGSTMDEAPSRFSPRGGPPVLRYSEVDACEPSSSFPTASALMLNPIKIQSQDLDTMLFCRLASHKMSVYLTSVEEIMTEKVPQS